MHPMLTIDPELQALCPSLNAEELEQLEASLLAAGCRDALVVWPRDGEQIIVDGHHRYTICQQHGLPYPVHEMVFGSQEEAVNWMINNQLGRRNLTPEQKSYLRGEAVQPGEEARGKAFAETPAK